MFDCFTQASGDGIFLIEEVQAGEVRGCDHVLGLLICLGRSNYDKYIMSRTTDLPSLIMLIVSCASIIYNILVKVLDCCKGCMIRVSV